MIRLRVPAQSARPGPPLSPVLGAHQIKPADFIGRFNELSAGWSVGVPVGVTVHKGATLVVRVSGPSTGVLLRGVRPTRTALWGILTLRGNTTPGGAATLLGGLRSLGLPVRR